MQAQVVAEENESRPGLWRYFLLAALLVADALALGGLTGMVVVNRLLTTQRDIYGEANMTAASVVLDLMDDVLPYTVGFGLAFLALTLMMAAAAAWLTRSRWLRVALVGLVLLAAAVAVVLITAGRPV